MTVTNNLIRLISGDWFLESIKLTVFHHSNRNQFICTEVVGYNCSCLIKPFLIKPFLR